LLILILTLKFYSSNADTLPPAMMLWF